MKIAVFLYHFPVLSETFILNQITGLIDRGHDVRIFCKSPYTDQIHHADIERYDLIHRTFYYRTPDKLLPTNRIVRVLKAVRTFLFHLNKNPLPLLKALNFFKYGRMASSLGIFYTTAPFLGENLHQYDIGHCHFGPNGDLAATLKELGAFRGKIVTTLHGEASYKKRKRYKKGYENLFQIGDLFLPMSEAEKQSLIGLGCDARKIIIHRMGIDTSKFAFAPHRSAHDGKVRLLTIGRLAEKKGIEYGVRSVAKLLRNHCNIEYKIAGDGPLKGELQSLIDELNVNDKIRMVGAKSQEEVIELFKNADLFLAPCVHSRDGDQEGIPVVIMEAMAKGMPVISTYHAGIPELVEDGISGFLVPERDVDALAQTLEYLLQHKDLWPTMGRRGRDHIEKHYDIDKQNDRLLQLFKDLTIKSGR